MSDTIGIVIILSAITALLIFRYFYYLRYKKEVSLKTDIIIGSLIIITAGAILLSIGRVPWCECGEIWLWSGNIESEHNSQHILDPYSFTHITHGILFYALFWIIGRNRWSIRLRGILAVATESAWEVLENTDWIIELYRTATISLGYYGDSVINSISDISLMVLGFLFVSRVPIWVSLLALLILELFLAYWIRDNLVLNIIMLIYPIEGIKMWQMGR